MNDYIPELRPDEGDIDVLSLNSEDKNFTVGLTKGGLSLLPFVGPMLVGVWDEFQQKRYQDIINELSTKMSLIQEEKIDKNFIATEECMDLFMRAFRVGINTRSKMKASFIFGMLTESILIDRNILFSVSLKESFLNILDLLTEEAITFLRDFVNKKYISKSRTDISRNNDDQSSIGLDALMSLELLKEDATWDKHIVESALGKKFIEYAKFISNDLL